VQFEHKLQTMHLASVEIGTMNHSREFCRHFVETMQVVVDSRIGDHVRSIDPVTHRKRVFAFVADKVTELHRTGNAIALMIMSEEGELQAVFADYLIVEGHTGKALMGQIYDETFIKKIGLSLVEIRKQCTGAAFDGAYFHLNNPDHLAKRIVEKAKGASATRSEITSLKEWLLCTWDPAHRLELVASDIRLDKLGVNVELVSVPWHVQIPKDIAAMYACCNYGKQYKKLLKTTKHLGKKWYAMAKFCDTRFAQSKLLVYKNFEKNYNTYRRTWGGDAEAVELEVDAAAAAAASSQATTAETTAAAALATKASAATIATQAQAA